MNNQNPRYSIYALRCPIDGKIKYVGSSQNLKQRYLGHVTGPNKCTKEWILSLRANNQWPIMDELEGGITRQKVSGREKYWIQKIQSEQGGLLNVRHVGPTAIPRVLPINFINQDDSN